MSDHPTPQQQPTLLPPFPSGEGQGVGPQTARWIPFSERLPEHGQWYARMYVYPDGEKELQTSAQFWHQDGQWAFNSYDGYRGRTFVIESLPPQIYWYPLPKEQDLFPWELRKGNEHINPEQQ